MKCDVLFFCRGLVKLYQVLERFSPFNTNLNENMIYKTKIKDHFLLIFFYHIEMKGNYRLPRKTEKCIKLNQSLENKIKH